MIAFVVTVAEAEAELAADVLWGLGVVAVEERAVDADPGHVELWTSVGDDPDAIERAVVRLSPGWRWRTERVDERVADTWRAHASPTVIDDHLVITPAWVPVPAGHGVGEQGVTVVSIEPGSTFGLGDHPTTVLTLRAVRRLQDEGVLAGASVLDVGCGSGVLGVAAVLLGAARADGIDISSAAAQATGDNAHRNGVAGLVTASTTPLAEVDGLYRVVLANILAPALIDLAHDLARVLDDDGVLVISGVLADHHDHVLAALAPLRVTQRDVLEGWAAISLQH